MMKKYYRVKVSNFLWEEGAIITSNESGSGYIPIEDIWDTTPFNHSEYISKAVIEHENNSQYFERVYTDDIKGKCFKTLDQMKQAYKEKFKS